MSEGDLGELSRHPVIAALEDRKERALPFSGYVGTSGEGILRLYTTLDSGAYVDIPQDAVLHVERSEDEEGSVRVFVSASATVTEVQQHQGAAEASSLVRTVTTYRTPPWVRELPPLVPRRPYPDIDWPWMQCERQCEADFASAAERARDLLNRANACYGRYFGTERQYQCDDLQAQAHAIIAQAVFRFTDCLRLCPPNPLATPAEIASRIYSKYFPQSSQN
jgi:hypothetical protein